MTALTGCVVPATQTVDLSVQRLATMAVCCTDFSSAQQTPLPLERTILQMDDAVRQVMEIDGAKAYFVLYQLPAYAKPYSVTVASNVQGMLSDGMVLLPKVKMLGADFQPLRQFDTGDLRRRGQSFERTVFVNAENQAEQYLVLYGDRPGRVLEGRHSQVTATPVVAGPVIFNVISGHDAVTRLHVAPSGYLTLDVNGLSAESKSK